MKPTLYKLGGSLLMRPQLGQMLDELLSRQPGHAALLVGGGETTDLVREWDRVHRLGNEISHWLAIRSLGLNAGLIEAIFPRARRVQTKKKMEAAWKQLDVPVLDCEAIVRAEESLAEDKLPHDWTVTSDSLAAWIAVRWKIPRLVLVKSVDYPQGMPLELGAREGLVDEYFPRLFSAESVHPALGWVNLREESPQVQWLLPLNLNCP